MKTLELAWEKVKRNRGAGGVDGQSLVEFEGDLEGSNIWIPARKIDQGCHAQDLA